MKTQHTVFVGLSGGVDSSVAAYLLKKEGYRVVGVFMKTWSPEWMPCTWKDERRDAMRVAAHLDIPFITIDLEEEYKTQVADYMIAEYRAGRVPNPDAMCNKEVKFGAFFKKAKEAGADFVATGHYARINLQHTTDNMQPTTHLLRGVDNAKDQSYFLWTVPGGVLKETLLPIGAYTKDAVRRMAKKTGLPTAEKKDSQGICFLGHVDLKEFLSHYIDLRKGAVLTMGGETIGEHEGALLYAEGQRHGFRITDPARAGRVWYVVGKDTQNNTITVSEEKAERNATTQEVELIGTNWIQKPEEGEEYNLELRYHGTPIKGSIKGTQVRLTTPRLVSPGQSLVVYKGDECLGGGIIA